MGAGEVVIVVGGGGDISVGGRNGFVLMAVFDLGGCERGLLLHIFV